MKLQKSQFLPRTKDLKLYIHNDSSNITSKSIMIKYTNLQIYTTKTQSQLTKPTKNYQILKRKGIYIFLQRIFY